MNESASTIATHEDEIARRTVALMLEADPAYAAQLDREARRQFEDDSTLHVRALIGSVIAGDPTISRDYAAWAAALLRHRGLGAQRVADLLRATGRAIAEIAPSASAAAAPHLKAGEDALSG